MSADTIRINNKNIPYPSKFSMNKVPNIVCEIVTMAGNLYADRNGWKYADTTLSWKALSDDDLQDLIDAASNASFDVTFLDATGTSETVRALNRGFGHSKMRYKNDGTFVWEDVTLNLSFPDCYQY